MKKILNFGKKALNWYSNKFNECYADRYQKYAYRFY